MIAVDTNILVYAHREDSSFYTPAAESVGTLAESGKDWAIPWPCLHEFVAIVTHPRIYRPPTPIEDALEQVEAWLDCPTLHVLGELSNVYWNRFARLVKGALVVGPQVHDARVAAICLTHGVVELWSADRDFSRFPELRVKNPLVRQETNST